MKRARRFISAHYLAWRVRRVARRSGARLADVFVRLVAAVLKIQSRTKTTPWIMIPMFGVAGLLGAAAYSRTIPDQYVSTALIGIGNSYLAGVSSEAERNLGIPSHWWFTSSEAMSRRQQILSRPTLTRLVHEEGLFEDELAHRPVEDLIQQMQTSKLRRSHRGEAGTDLNFWMGLRARVNLQPRWNEFATTLYPRRVDRPFWEAGQGLGTRRPILVERPGTVL